MRHKLPLLMLSTILTLSACATQTPIAVSTPQYKTPPNPPALQAQETEAQAKTQAALSDWNKYLTDLPTRSDSPTQH